MSAGGRAPVRRSAATEVPPSPADAQHAIRDVLYRYCRGVDRVDLELVRDCYHDDAVDDHGAFRGPPDAYVAWLADRLRAYEHTSHTLGNVLIEVGGGRGWSRSARRRSTTPRVLPLVRRPAAAAGTA